MLMITFDVTVWYFMALNNV